MRFKKASDGDDFLDLGDFLLEDPLDAHLEGQLGHGAAAAGAGQLDLDDTVRAGWVGQGRGATVADLAAASETAEPS